MNTPKETLHVRDIDSLERKKIHIDHILEKGVGKVNEDVLLIGDYRFGVFDGATSLDGYTDAEGRTGGYIASRLAHDIFQRSRKSVREAAYEANDKILQAMTSKGIDIARKENQWNTSCAVVDIDSSGKEFEWTQINDSLILLIYTDNSHKMLIENYDHDIELLSEWQQLPDKREGENILVRLRDEVIKGRREMGINYGSLNGESTSLNFLKNGRESLKNVKHILIKKDPRSEDDFSLMTKLFLEGGLPRIRNYIRDIEEADPYCWKYPRPKKSDDIGAIAVNFR